MSRLTLLLPGGKLVYRVLDTPVARKWSGLLARCDLRRPRAQWYLGGDQAAFDLKSAELAGVVAELRSLGLEPPAAGTDGASLNALHEFFSVHARAGGRRHELVNRVNVLVHWLETFSRGHHGFAVVDFGQPPPPVPMAPEDYESLLLDPRFGDLVLGYNRIGKSLPHCFYDDDEAPLRRREIVPASVVTTQCVAYFSRPDYPPGYVASKRRRYEAWCREKRAADYGYDCAALEHLPGSPLVARLERPADESLIRDGAPILSAALD